MNKSKLLLICCMIIFVILLGTGYSENKYILCKSNIAEGELQINEGILDHKIIMLDGKWQFYPFSLKPNAEKIPQLISVPGDWKQVEDSRGNLADGGYGVYRLLIKVPKAGQYCINTKFISSAHQVWINGQYMGGAGSVGISEASEKSSWQPKVFSFYSQQKEIEVIIQVSNYHCDTGGIISSLLFGTQELFNQIYAMRLINTCLLLGVFLGLAIYIMLINRSVHQSDGSFYLGTFCISAILIEMILDDGILFYIFPSLSCGMGVRIEYLAYVVLLISMQLFVTTTYPGLCSKKSVNSVMALEIFYAIVVLISETRILGRNNFIYLGMIASNICIYLVMCYRAIITKRKHAAFLVIGIVAVIVGYIIEQVKWINVEQMGELKNINAFLLGLLIFGLCQCCVSSIQIEEAYKKAQYAYKMEIAFLQAQITPHFFFNALNNIYCLMEMDICKAKRLLMSLCHFLRVKYRFDFSKQLFYALEQELTLIRSYLEIENIRLNDQIDFKLDVDEGLMEVEVLPFILQPFVENAIKHGFQSKPMKIIISVQNKGDRIHFEIEDTGKGMGEDRIFQILDSCEGAIGIGIKNTNYRLSRCYHTHLNIKSKIGEGTKVTFDILKEALYAGRYY